jgi:hypothetical protein
MELLLRYGVFCVTAPRIYNGDLRQLESGEIRCRKGTPIMKKKPNPSILSKEEQRKKKKTKVLTLNKYMAMDPSGARCRQ